MTLAGENRGGWRKSGLTERMDGGGMGKNPPEFDSIILTTDGIRDVLEYIGKYFRKNTIYSVLSECTVSTFPLDKDSCVFDGIFVMPLTFTFNEFYFPGRKFDPHAAMTR